jgi:conjugal transfer mating pair stabilization protein TraN
VLYAIYTILNFAYKIMFSCDNDDMETSVKLTLKLCHYVGQTSEKVLGLTVKTRNVYCCFNSILARLIQEQGKEQLGMGWGTGDSPNCNGFSAGDISNMDFSVMDLTEYMQYVQEKSTLTTEEQAEALNKAMSTVQSTTTYNVPAATTP